MLQQLQFVNQGPQTLAMPVLLESIVQKQWLVHGKSQGQRLDPVVERLPQYLFR